MDSDKDPLLVPLQLQAFILNPAVCNTDRKDDHGARIAPITQPNYTFLRLDNYSIQSDVLNHADLHCAAPAGANPRLTDFSTIPPTERRNRQGVYLHWILPQTYRHGLATGNAADVETPQQKNEQEPHDRGPGLKISSRDGSHQKQTTQTSEIGESSYEFIEPPTRWIVIRKLDLNTVRPMLARQYFKEYQAWVVESDYIWDLENIPPEYDLQVDASPFVISLPSSNGKNGVEQHVEVFIGRKTPLEKWTEHDCVERADLSLPNNSNELFADFQMHNSNVFSILDNFEYFDTSYLQQKYLDEASASYYLLGWHRDEAKDPFCQGEDSHSRSQTLAHLLMSFQNNKATDDKAVESWLGSDLPTRTCLHAALYDVHWTYDRKPLSVPADEYAGRLRDKTMPIVSLGSNPADALATHLSSKRMKKDGNTHTPEKQTHMLDTYLERVMESHEDNMGMDFEQSDQTVFYSIPGLNGREPGTAQLDHLQSVLKSLNDHQTLIAACRETLQQYRKDIFYLWWKYASDINHKNDQTYHKQSKEKVTDISEKLMECTRRIAYLNKTAQKLLESVKIEASTESLEVTTAFEPPFLKRCDPMVVIGDIGNEWPIEFMESRNIQVRLPSQTIRATTSVPIGLADIKSLVEKNFSRQPALRKVNELLEEFWALIPNNATIGPLAIPQGNQAYPQFHDQLSTTQEGTKLWRDRWEDRQPWLPLYVEWEVEYLQTPFEDWAAEKCCSSHKTTLAASDERSMLLSEEKEKRSLGDVDTRTISGRVILRSHQDSSATAILKQLRAHASTENSETSNADTQNAQAGDEFEKQLERNLLIVSLTGLTDGLLTLRHGTHITPEDSHANNGDGDIITSAKPSALFQAAGFSEKIIEMIAGNSSLTPYAASADFSRARFCPFKPVTHGQFRYVY